MEVGNQVRTEHCWSPSRTSPHWAPKAVPSIVSVSPPRGEEDVGEIELTLGVREEEYWKLPPDTVRDPSEMDISEADLLRRDPTIAAEVRHWNSP